ncbi:MAG: energy transducer TonB [Alphaproteobacteria bacterium]|nr:energy transducer TonB [Alphaproteobacteria bacterium]MDE1986636.1 energy transducer TonB [Alphaproteobacteria bacterium]MDE2164448.1 energy transducer TonB [Alphaproteobacteria bacterium]MDE2499089.1 energy transducer TonB [Alphaproteobacteria bacterium]
MIFVEFLVFVISSGLFCSERFRGNLYALLFAGGVATASSLLFVYHIGTMFTVHAAVPPPPKIIRQVVRVPVVQNISQPPSLSKPQNCHDDYPFLSRLLGQEGTTDLAFHVLADGVVDGVTVAKSSGSERLDDAAVGCVRKWHYLPAIKDGKLTDVPWTAQVVWSLDDPKPADTTTDAADAKPAAEKK